MKGGIYMLMYGEKMLNYQMTFNRVYHFSAAHRLQNPLISKKANKSVYDKCNNYHGHGHDYKLEVSLEGTPDLMNGMIMPLESFDINVKSVLNKLNFRHLDLEIKYFSKNISTGEIIIQFLWDELNQIFPKGMLFGLKLWETNNNYFELIR